MQKKWEKKIRIDQGGIELFMISKETYILFIGEPIVKKIVGAPVVRHHHNHVVAQPAFAHLAHAHVAHPVAAAPVAAAPVHW